MTTQLKVPPADPLSNYLAHKEEIDVAIHSALEGGRYIHGPQVRAFEEEFANYLGIKDVVGVGNGTDALAVALRSLGVGSGDRVISVSHTAVATIAAIEMTGAEPILVDIDADNFVMSIASLERTLHTYRGQSLKAILPVHLYGRMVNMKAVLALAQQDGLRVIEDCAQAHGASLDGKKAGTWGSAATFSFYPTKNLGAIGDGGAVASNDLELIARVRLFSEYGWRERYISELAGVNTRLDELQAAILRVKLDWLETENQRRQEIAQMYQDGLCDIEEVRLPETGLTGHVYHQYVIRCTLRDALRRWLQEQGIGTLIHYPAPVHLQPAYKDRLLCDPEGLGVTEQICSQIVSLPMYPQLSNIQIEQVISAIRAFFRQTV
jgi:dTDP-4-amino-4,6-dideoxygalactose transaminase